MLLIFNYVLLFLMIFLALQMLLSHNTGISLHYKRKHQRGSKIRYHTSSRNRRGSDVLLSRATATREAMQYLRNQAHLCVSAQQGSVSNSRSQARATSTCSHQKLTIQGHSETQLTFYFTSTACQRQPPCRLSGGLPSEFLTPG